MNKTSSSTTCLTEPESRILASNNLKWEASRPVSKTRALVTRTSATRHRCQSNRINRISSSSTLNNKWILSNTNKTLLTVLQLTMRWHRTIRCGNPTLGRPHPSTFPTTWRAVTPPTTSWKINKMETHFKSLHLHHPTQCQGQCQTRQVWAKINHLKEISFLPQISRRRLALQRQHWADKVHSVGPPKVRRVKRCYQTTPLVETR